MNAIRNTLLAAVLAGTLPALAAAADPVPAERAARELEAAGGAATQRNPRYDTGLTARERHISRLVRQGLGNAEVADQLLISHRTVEWHLRNIYNKLGITSRRELRLADL